MELGIFAKTFTRPTVGDVFQAIRTAGLSACQFNFGCAGLAALPDSVPEQVLKEIAQAAQETGVRIPAVSGTFNMIDPNRWKRSQNIERLKAVISAAEALHIPVITLCTGTRDPEDMWRPHPENSSSSAWRDLVETLSQVLPEAERAGRTLAFEPEQANVIDSAAKARGLLDVFKSSALKLVFDGANLLRPQDRARQQEIWNQALDSIGAEISVVHVKDVRFEPEARATASGAGEVDLPVYLSLLRQRGWNGPLILHGMTETEVTQSVQFVQAALRSDQK